jgi:phasin family protein
MDGAQSTIFDPEMTVETFTKTTGKITSFGQGNVEAIMKSGQVWAAGCQDISKALAVTAQAQFDLTMSTWRALISGKSLKDVMEMRASVPQASFEKVLAETGRITDASVKLAEEAMAPIAARIAVALENFKSLSN